MILKLLILKKSPYPVEKKWTKPYSDKEIKKFSKDGFPPRPMEIKWDELSFFKKVYFLVAKKTPFKFCLKPAQILDGTYVWLEFVDRDMIVSSNKKIEALMEKPVPDLSLEEFLPSKSRRHL